MPNQRTPMQARVALWTTADGRKIPINRLSADHLANIIRALTKRHNSDDPRVTSILRHLTQERERRRKLWQQVRKGLYNEAEPIKEIIFPGEEE